MRELLFISPIFKEKLWGGSRLKSDYNYDIPSEHTGECWAISAHPEGDCTIANGIFKGTHLSELWRSHKELFGYPSEDTFPLLVKIIDAREDLSIQVHPDDDYAKLYENGSFGKTECWYILDCPEDGTIIVGHHANDKAELKKMIEEDRYMELLNIKKIKQGDFLQITPGTLHAIKASTLLLETQQNSDITYRVYDYNRLQDGKPRELQLQKSLDVIQCPYKDDVCQHHVIKGQDYILEQLVNCQFYTVNRVSVSGTATFRQEHSFMLCSVIGGEGCLDQYFVKKGDHFIIPYEYGTFEIKGNVQMILSNT